MHDTLHDTPHDASPGAADAPAPVGAYLPQARPLLIGLIGRAGAGKSTVAARLAHAWGFEAFGFADPILGMACALMREVDVDHDWAVERALKEQPMPVLGVSYRRIAQTLGTDWGRALIHPDLWLDIAAHKVRGAHARGNSAVISDVRFPNEAAWVLHQGGLLVRVVRPGPAAQLADAQAAQHASERHVQSLPAHLELQNDADLRMLDARVDALLHSMHTASA